VEGVHKMFIHEFFFVLPCKGKISHLEGGKEIVYLGTYYM